MSKIALWGIKEELKPCGEKGLQILDWRENKKLDNCFVCQSETHPWFLIVWEKLNTKAPNPSIASPYCCYINTVIFYVRGYILNQFSHFYKIGDKWRVTEPGKIFQEWDKVDSVLGWNDILVWNGEEFEYGNGRVIWKNKQWWIRHWARRRAKKI